MITFVFFLLAYCGTGNVYATGSQPKVAVIGGGLGGLTAAYRIAAGKNGEKNGWSSVVFEATNTLGGRVNSGTFPDGQVYERGGELIDTLHTDIRDLADELGLQQEDRLAAEPEGVEPYYFWKKPNGSLEFASFTQMENDWKGISSTIRGDRKAAGYPTDIFESTEEGRALDSISLHDYIQGLDTTERFKQIIDVTYNIEFGAETVDQSPLNLLFLLGYSPKKVFSTFGESDERFHIQGGNHLLVDRLQDRLNELGIEIKFNHRLREVKRLADGRYQLTFDHPFSQGAQPTVKVFDRIVLAIPFSVMRDDPRFDWYTDVSQAGFSALKQTAIQELQYGRNAKVNVQFNTRFWYNANLGGVGNNGDIFASRIVNGEETQVQNVWEVSKPQPGVKGILVNYTGGDYSDRFQDSRHASAANTLALALDFVQKLDQLIPGALANFTPIPASSGEEPWANISITTWSDNPYARGSYSYWMPGQYASGTPNIAIAGIESLAEPLSLPDGPQRNAHFAGEHTSYDYQGYLNGAVNSGERAAKEVRKALKELGVPKDIQQ